MRHWQWRTRNFVAWSATSRRNAARASSIAPYARRITGFALPRMASSIVPTAGRHAATRPRMIIERTRKARLPFSPSVARSPVFVGARLPLCKNRKSQYLTPAAKIRERESGEKPQTSKAGGGSTLVPKLRSVCRQSSSSFAKSQVERLTPGPGGSGARVKGKTCRIHFPACGQED